MGFPGVLSVIIFMCVYMCGRGGEEKEGGSGRERGGGGVGGGGKKKKKERGHEGKEYISYVVNFKKKKKK